MKISVIIPAFNEAENIVNKYKDLAEVLLEEIKKLEKEQADLGVGFVRKEHLELSDQDMDKEMKNIFETKINPVKINN